MTEKMLHIRTNSRYGGLFLALMFMMLSVQEVHGEIPPVPEIPERPSIISGKNIYHVNNMTGKDQPDAGTMDNPWETITYALNHVQAGDTLLIYGTGQVYQTNWATILHPGTTQRWISIRGVNGQGGERVILRGRLSIGGKETGAVEYVHMKNMVFDGPGGNGVNIVIHDKAENIVFEDIEVDCNKDPENSRAVWTGKDVKKVWFQNVSVRNCGYRRDTALNAGLEQQVPTDCGGICIKGEYIDEIVFDNVKSINNVGDGIGGGSRISFGKVYYRNCITEGNTGDGIDQGGSLVVIVNCISRNNGGHQGAGFKVWSKESWLVGSVAYQNEYSGVSVNHRHNGLSRAYVLNSTLVMNSIGRYGGQIGTTSKLLSEGILKLYIHNNIMHALNTSAIVIQDIDHQEIASEGHNYYFKEYDAKKRSHWTHKHAVHMRGNSGSTIQGFSFNDLSENGRWNASSGEGVGNIILKKSRMKTDPGFTDISSGDLRLSKSSFAIDAGLDLGIRRDIEGNIIPNGDAPDIGAFEFYDSP